LLAALFSVVFAVLVWVMLQGVQYRQPAVTDLKVFGTVQWVAVQLFTKYLYPFELTSLLLLVAAIGAIYLSKRNIEGESPVEGLRPAADDGGTLPPKSEDL
jgi:NADH-quinone oxidoreductase subunit J